MTLSNSVIETLSTKNSTILTNSNTSWDVLYCPHLWSDSNLRNVIINAPSMHKQSTKYCYRCRGKIRKYEITRQDFIPNIHSTPNSKTLSEVDPKSNDIRVDTDSVEGYPQGLSYREADNNDPPTISHRCIPTISQQVDSSSAQRYTAAAVESRRNSARHHRLAKSLKGIGCVVSLALNNTNIKKRTQIQACSISLMIVAIVIISFVLVNFTSPNYKNNIYSTNPVVPTLTRKNASSSAIMRVETTSSRLVYVTESYTTAIDVTTSPRDVDEITSKSSTETPAFIAKIRKNVKTYLKDTKRNQSNTSSEEKPKAIINSDVSFQFCSCQSNEVCMLDENSGTAVCKKSVDVEDPTGCGGLCALETEACQLVDKARGVRVCRLLSLLSCGAHEWRCHNGLCVDAAARCDGAINCYDRSDEMHCDCDLTQQFRCGNSISCFPKWRLCDGAIDCWDGFDELNCTSACPKEQFTCNNGECILQARFCDGYADCSDHSDEPQGCGGDCSSREVTCDNHRCVPLTAKCDGLDNCGDNTDERNCV